MTRHRCSGVHAPLVRAFALLLALSASAIPRAMDAQISKIARPTTGITLSTIPNLAPAHSLRAGTTPTSIALRWTCVEGPTGYDVYAAPPGGAVTKLNAAPLGPCLQDLQLRQDPRFPSASGTVYVGMFNHSPLMPNQEFTYFVRAIYPNGVADSGPLTARSLWPAPANLTLTFTNPDQISLAWQPVSGVPGYLVFRKTIWDTDYRPLTATPQTATTYSDIWYAMPAWYYVKAVDGAQSNIVEFKPPPSP